MAAWRTFSLIAERNLFNRNGLLGGLLPKTCNTVQNQAGKGSIRCMSEHVMQPTASRWQWHKTKDWLHFYFFVGAIPAGLLVFYTNVFIGPATLEEIPEGYHPKPWEYYRHPISRFLARYVYPHQQMEYEKLIHTYDRQFDKMRLHQLERQVRECVNEFGDYRYWSFKRVISHENLRRIRKAMDAGDISI